jgi:hypothetical protein
MTILLNTKNEFFMITDTTKKPHREWLGGGNPSAIEDQEAQGQKELVASSQLPRKLNPRSDAKEVYKKMGIKVSDDTKDPLFYDVVLPTGWKIKATDHSMWSTLLDENSNEVGSIFYKAAFYDRDAFINIKP